MKRLHCIGGPTRRSAASIVFGLMMIGSATQGFAHQGQMTDAPWVACDDATLGELCSFEDAQHAVYRGTCQLMTDTLMCVRNQPIEHADHDHDQAHDHDHVQDSEAALAPDDTDPAASVTFGNTSTWTSGDWAFGQLVFASVVFATLISSVLMTVGMRRRQPRHT